MADEATKHALNLDDVPHWMTCAEAAQIARVTVRTIRRWVSVRYIRAYRPAGGRVLIDRDSLRDFVEGSAA